MVLEATRATIQRISGGSVGPEVYEGLRYLFALLGPASDADLRTEVENLRKELNTLKNLQALGALGAKGRPGA